MTTANRQPRKRPRPGRRVNIRYVGQEGGAFQFVVDGPDRPAMQMMDAENDVFSWLADHLAGPNRYAITRTKDNRLKVGIGTAVDVARFDRTFKVEGLTPDALLDAA
jgi:hypothetical protein